MSNLVFSRFYHKFIKGDVVCCYNALTMNTVYTTFEAIDDFEKKYNGHLNKEIDKKLYNRLKEENIIVEEGFDDELLTSIRNECFSGVSIRVMVLQMTDFCNLKCKYCFVEGGQTIDYQRRTMHIDTAKSAVNKFVEIIRKCKTEKKKPTIVFYGGEPLLNWETISELLEYIVEVEYKEGIKFDKVIITNGVLLNESMAKTIKRHGVLVSVSLDGIESVHDSNRVDYLNKGSFKKTVKGIKLLQKVGVYPAVSCVMAKEGIPHYKESIKFLVDDLKVQGLGFNHVSIIPGLNYYDPKYEESFADAIISVQEIIQKQYPNVYERRMGHKVNTFIDKRLIKSDCTGCGEQISISPLGEIGICQGYMGSRKTFNHTVFEKDYFPDDDAIFIEWSKRSPLNIEECLSCPALATCGGGCPRNADMIHNTIWKIDSAFCHFAKKAQEWLIWQKISK